MLIGERRRISRAKKKHDVSKSQVRREMDFDNWRRSIHKDGMYPLDAPGMPLPGPNFLRHAKELGDQASDIVQVKIKDETKKSGYRTGHQAKVGEVLRTLYLRALREPGFTLPIAMKGGRSENVVFIPGHIWSQHISNALSFAENPKPVDGPHPADVMVIGKMPWKEEIQYLRNLVGPSGETFIDVINGLKIPNSGRWYITNLLKFMPPDGTTNIRADWLKDCLPLLHEELRIVRPKYILCLGAEASKELLGKSFGVNYMEGRVVEYTYPTGLSVEDQRLHTSLVMTVIHPVNAVREESLKRTLERGMARFNLLQSGVRFDKEEQGIDHRMVSSLEELEDLLYEIEKHPDKKDSVIAMDAEWHGEHPVNRGSYMRTIQLAWLPKHAAAVKLHHAGGKPSFKDAFGKPAHKRGIALLKTFLCGGKYKGMAFRPKRVVGHFFVADLEWLIEAGLDIRDQYAVPLYDTTLSKCPPRLRKRYRRMGFHRTVPAWARTKYEGGGDTGYRAHAIEESANLKLEMLALRYTTVPRYDVPLHDWRESYCKEHGLKSKDLEGYGECPDEILVPYGCYDADATLRLFYVQDSYLDCDYEGNCCREPAWEAEIASLPILEIHRNGIMVDRKRIDYLTQKFMTARENQEAKIKRWARWHDFNIRSVLHVKEFLYGTELNGKVTKDGAPVRIRPSRGEACGFCTKGYVTVEQDGKPRRRTCQICQGTGRSRGARSLNLTPLIDTGKPPKLWTDLVQAGTWRQHSPSTNKQVLSILAQENEQQSLQVNWIRDYRFLDQVLKSVLRPPRVNEDGNWAHDDNGSDDGGLGDLLYDAGLASVICDDGRVRTHLYPTTETGRWRCARPNLQNMSKQRDPDYTRLLGGEKNAKGKWVGGDYKFPLRSILMASPGHVLVEADYIGAELYGMAIMSGDPTMIDHATRNQLREDDPNYYDIHSNVAVMAFKLRCKPTKHGLDEIGKAHLRIIAKNVIFGIAYGRQAKAIAFAAKEQGIDISVFDAQRVIDTIFEMYPGLVPFFEEAKERAIKHHWLCHCFGRFRRFPSTNDFKLEGEFERQAMNFPIQGMIASAVDRAIAYLYDYKRNCGNPDLFRILLQIHDALLLEVPYEHVEFVAKHVLPWAMRKMVPIYPTSLDGRPTGKGPYYLGIDVGVSEHWGEKLKEERAQALGFKEKQWAGDGVVVTFAA